MEKSLDEIYDDAKRDLRREMNSIYNHANRRISCLEIPPGWAASREFPIGCRTFMLGRDLRTCMDSSNRILWEWDINGQLNVHLRNCFRELVWPKVVRRVNRILWGELA